MNWRQLEEEVEADAQRILDIEERDVWRHKERARENELERQPAFAVAAFCILLILCFAVSAVIGTGCETVKWRVYEPTRAVEATSPPWRVSNGDISGPISVARGGTESPLHVSPLIGTSVECDVSKTPVVCRDASEFTRRFGK